MFGLGLTELIIIMVIGIFSLDGLAFSVVVGIALIKIAFVKK